MPVFAAGWVAGASFSSFTAFEKYVLLNEEPQQIARELDLHINTVYRAKDQLTRLLKVRLAQLREDE